MIINIKIIKAKLELTLLFIAFMLISIWCTAGTIGFRNILLITGSMLVIYYLIVEKQTSNEKGSLKIIKNTPAILILISLIWVIAHYLFIGEFHNSQQQELISTWKRVLMACILGMGVGHILIKLNFFNYLWIGILISVIIYILQFSYKNIFNINEFRLIYEGKANLSFTGGILLITLLGAWIEKQNNKILFLIIVAIYSLLLSNIYISNSRAGTIFTILIVIYILINFLYYSQKNQKIIAIILTTITIIFSIYIHNSKNSGWKTILYDLESAYKSSKVYNTTTLPPFPINRIGVQVTGNTFERGYWGILGVKEIIRKPFGVGVLRYPLTASMNPEGYLSFSKNTSSHSGWIDLGLAYGIPMLAIMFTIIAILISRCIFQKELNNRITYLVLILFILIIYSTSELSEQHNVEILFFILSILSISTKIR